MGGTMQLHMVCAHQPSWQSRLWGYGVARGVIGCGRLSRDAAVSSAWD